MRRHENHYMQVAFDAICEDRVQADEVYLTLYESVPFYGGPEEGGWWGSDDVVAAYQHFSTREQAVEARERVEELARIYCKQAQQAYGERCRDELDWLEARGLDPDFLPEPDGPTTYFVRVESTLGSHESRGCRHYE